MTYETLFFSYKDPPSPPENLDFSIIGTSVRVTWTPPSSSPHCIVNYIAKSDANATDIITTDTQVEIPLVDLPNATYCVSVVAIDTANRKGKKVKKCALKLKVQCTNQFVSIKVLS